MSIVCFSLRKQRELILSLCYKAIATSGNGCETSGFALREISQILNETLPLHRLRISPFGLHTTPKQGVQRNFARHDGLRDDDIARFISLSCVSCEVSPQTRQGQDFDER